MKNAHVKEWFFRSFLWALRPEDVREERAKGSRVSELDARCGFHSVFHERHAEQRASLCGPRREGRVMGNFQRMEQTRGVMDEKWSVL